MKCLSTVMFLCMLINAQGQLTYSSNWKTYYDSTFYFSLKYPVNWEFHNEIKNAKCIIYTPVYKGAKYRANLAVDAFELPATGQETTVRDFAEVRFKEFAKNIKDCKVMAAKDISQNGIPQFLVVANGIINGKYLYVKQVYCLYSNIGYIINYMGEAGISDPYSITAGDILNSFKPQKTISQ